MKKIIILVFEVLFATSNAQDIQMEFPYFRGKSYDFIIFQGTTPKTIIQSTIPQDGKFTLSIPKEYTLYTGMGRWLITGTIEGGGMDMVIPGHNFSVSCTEAKPDDNNIIYSGNTQIKELSTLYKEQQDILARHDAMMQAIRAFSKTDNHYPIFEKEYNNQIIRYKNFQQKLNVNKDYAKQFLQIVNITQGIGTEILDTEEKNARNISEYLVKEMDWQILYTSGHWPEVISAWVEIHTQVLKNLPRFLDDFTAVSKKISNPDQYIDFADRVAYFLLQHGKDDYVGAIAPMVISSGKIKNYEGSLAVYVKGTVGTKAPDLIFKARDGKQESGNYILKSSELAVESFTKTLLIYYKSGCSYCNDLLQQLSGGYENIRSEKIRVISISADEDENIHYEKAKKFLWKDSFRDLEGSENSNFKNYGIVGTPTLVLLDAAGKIVLRTTSMEDLWNFQK